MNILRCVLAILAMQLCHSSISFGQAEPTNAEAVKSLRKAAEQGDAYAQRSLGGCYQEGIGVPKDYSEAARWYRKAAEQGDAAAQSSLGVCYQEGMGVPKDYSEAARWYRKAAEQGDAYAQRSLGLSYLEGIGVPKDYVEGYKWLNIGAASSVDRKILQIIEAQMTPEQITEAQKLSREWKPVK